MNIIPPAFNFSDITTGLKYKNLALKLYESTARELISSGLNTNASSKIIDNSTRINTYVYRNSIYNSISGVVNIATKLQLVSSEFEEDIEVYLDAGGYGQIPEMYYTDPSFNFIITPLGSYQRWQVIKSQGVIGTSSLFQILFNQLTGINTTGSPSGFDYVNYIEKRFGNSHREYILISNYSQPILVTNNKNELIKEFGTRGYPKLNRNIGWLSKDERFFCNASYRTFENGTSLSSFLPLGDTRTRNSQVVQTLDSINAPTIKSNTEDSPAVKGVYIDNIFYCLPSTTTRASNSETSFISSSIFDYHVCSLVTNDTSATHIFSACTTSFAALKSGAINYRSGPTGINFSYSSIISPSVEETIVFEESGGGSSSKPFKNISTLNYLSNVYLDEDSTTTRKNILWMEIDSDNKYFFVAYYFQPTASTDIADITVRIVRWNIDLSGSNVSLSNRTQLYEYTPVISITPFSVNQIIGGFRCQIDKNGNYIIGFIKNQIIKSPTLPISDQTVSSLKVFFNKNDPSTITTSDYTINTRLSLQSFTALTSHVIFADYITNTYCCNYYEDSTDFNNSFSFSAKVHQHKILLHLASKNNILEYQSFNINVTTDQINPMLGLGKAIPPNLQFCMPTYDNMLGGLSITRKSIVYIPVTKIFNTVEEFDAGVSYIIKINMKTKKYSLQKLPTEVISSYIVLANKI